MSNARPDRDLLRRRAPEFYATPRKPNGRGPEAHRARELVLAYKGTRRFMQDMRSLACEPDWLPTAGQRRVIFDIVEQERNRFGGRGSWEHRAAGFQVLRDIG